MTSAYLDWKQGDRIECINGTWRSNSIYPLEQVPVEGTVYTLREIAEIEGKIAVHLEEVSNPVLLDMRQEPWFAAEQFRKVVDRPTSISIFTKMLRKSEAKNRRELERLNEERGAPMELPLW